MPDRINLWVSKEAYLRDLGITNSDALEGLIKSLPAPAEDLIHINWVPNTGPYRKLIPILRKSNTDDLIVTADDDIFYGRNWLSKLLEEYQKSGGKLIATRARLKKVNFLGRKTSYLFWPLINQTTVADDSYIVTFGGGAVLTKSMFREADIVDDAFLHVAPTADDLWYSKLLERNRNQIVVVPHLLNELNFIQHEDGLDNYNFSKATSLLAKVQRRTWRSAAGFLGFSICGNDYSYAKIERYFRKN